MQLDKIREITRRTKNDSFFSRTSPLSMLIGTIIMWVSLAHLSTGLNMQITKNLKEV